MVLAVLAAASTGVAGAAAAAPATGLESSVSTLIAQDASLRQQTEEYAQEFKVDTGEARQRLTAIHAVTRNASRLTASLGDRYGGMWFNNETGRMHVGATGDRPAAAAALETASATLGVSDRITVTAVKSSQAELLDAFKALTGTLGKTGRFSFGVQEQHNRILIEAADPAAPEIGQAREMLARRGVAVSVVRRPAAELETVDDVCQSVTTCSPPLHGGQQIRSDPTLAGTLCSATGFGYVWGAWVVVTAGHCLTPYDGNRSWHGLATDGYHVIGRQWAWTRGAYGDFGIIRVEDNFWQPAGTRSLVNLWGTDNDWPVQGVAQSQPAGIPLCRAGRTTGVRCGISEGGPFMNGDVGYQFRMDGSYAGLNMCSEGGDSGGPVMSWTTLYGLTTSSTSATCAQGPERVHYQPHEMVTAFTGLGFLANG